MAKYLVEKLGAGKFAVGSLVELTTSQAEFYKRKIRLIPDQAPAKVEQLESQESRLEVATPKPKPKRKTSAKKQTKTSPFN